MSSVRIGSIWFALVLVVAIPLGAAATSPLLQWRELPYIAAGFAGISALSLLLFQPLLAAGLLPGFSTLQCRRIHRWVGSAVVLFVILHVAGLWLTSPPDVIDALLFVSPTPFSLWGVIAMWSLFVSGSLALLRRRLHVRPATWRLVHKTLAVVTVIGSAVHALRVEGTMEFWSKSALCLLIFLATAVALVRLKSQRQ